MIKKHTKKSQDNPQGKIVEREGALHISNVKVVEVVTEKPKSKKKKAA
jgi:large subunit ribosomal protein L24